MRIRTLIAAAAAPAALAGVLLTSAAASAAPLPHGTYTVTAHENGTPDTTDVSGPATVSTGDGPVWAYDDLVRKISAVSNGDGTWAVTITSQGSFHAIANPVDGNPWTGSGSVKGFVNYTVTSDHAPDSANLTAQLPDTLHSSGIVARWFGVDPSAVQGAVVNGQNYQFDYTPVPVPASPVYPNGYLDIFYGQGSNGLHYTQAG